MSNYGIIGLIEIQFQTANVLLFWLAFMIICSYSKNKWIRICLSMAGSAFIGLQITSLYFVRKLAGYELYVHFNVRDISILFNLFLWHISGLVVMMLVLCAGFYSSPEIGRWLRNTKPRNSNHSIVRALQIVVVVVFITVSSFEKGMIQSGLELFELFNTDTVQFSEALKRAGYTAYTSPEQIDARQGRNVILISLESIERGYLSDKFAHLTPNLSSLKQQWSYLDIHPNVGSAWTSASLYTTLTGFPALFGVHGNEIFNKTYYSGITSVSGILKKAGYKVEYLVNDAQFSGTQQMLYTLGFDDIIDKTTLGVKTLDKDLFDRAKAEIMQLHKANQPFAFFMSTFDTHAPNGQFDPRMAELIPQQPSDLEFMVSALDYLVNDLIVFLKSNKILENTTIFILPDHLKMGDPALFNNTGKRGLFFLTNADINHYEFENPYNLYQIDLPWLILKGAEVEHNAKFLSDFISGDKNKYIRENIPLLTMVNTSGLLRMNDQPYELPQKTTRYQEYSNDTSRFIAHAGGKIGQYTYTNSIEALDSSYAKGFRLFELDIIKTKDGKYVAAHDWKHWSKMVGLDSVMIPTEQEFMNFKIVGKYTPMNMKLINKWFEMHDDAYLITDKINEPAAFTAEFNFKNRLIMELFSIEAVKEGVEIGLRGTMPSQQVLEQLGTNNDDKLKDWGIEYAAVSRRFIQNNKDYLHQLQNIGIKVYAYHVNHDYSMDERYVVKYEMDHIYGIYADEWSFGQ